MLARAADRNLKGGHAENVFLFPPRAREKSLILDAMAVWRKSMTETFAVKAFSSEGETWWAWTSL